MTYKEKLLDPRWQKKRLEILERDNWTCGHCGDTETTLHVHHFYYEKGKDPWEIDDYGLMAVCADCHAVNHLKMTELEKSLLGSVRSANRGNAEFLKLVNRVVTNAINDRENG